MELVSRQGRRTVVSMGVERALLPVSAGTRHRLLDHEPSVILVLALSDGFLRRDHDVWEIWRRLQSRSVNVRVMEGGFAGWWRRAVLEQTLQDPGYVATVRAMALRVLVAAERNAASPDADSTEERVRSVQRRVRETFFEDWTIDRAAQQAGLFRRQFTLRLWEIAGERLWLTLATCGWRTRRDFSAVVATALRVPHSRRALRTSPIFTVCFASVMACRHAVGCRRRNWTRSDLMDETRAYQSKRCRDAA